MLRVTVAILWCSLSCVACGDDSSPGTDVCCVADGAGAADQGTASDGGVTDSGGGPAGLPSQTLAKLAGSYSGTVTLGTGEATNYLDQGQSYDFSITSAGRFELTGTKNGALVFLWDGVGDRVEQANDITVLLIEEIGGRTMAASWRAADGLFKVSGAFVHPAGAWALGSIQNK